MISPIQQIVIHVKVAKLNQDMTARPSGIFVSFLSLRYAMTARLKTIPET